jgi:hypothetical protein
MTSELYPGIKTGVIYKYFHLQGKVAVFRLCTQETIGRIGTGHHDSAMVNFKRAFPASCFQPVKVVPSKRLVNPPIPGSSYETEIIK